MFTLIVTAIVLFLLLLGTAIPILRGTVSVTDDLETPDGISVRLHACMLTIVI